MEIRRVGTSDGFPVVALHGIQGTNDSWVPLATALGDAFEFILPNLPGRGDAAFPASAKACSADAFAQLAGDVIAQEIGARPYVLAGWSMGVSVIFELMAQLANGTARHAPPVAVMLMSGTAQLNEVRWFEASEESALRDEIRQREIRLGLKRAAHPQVVAWTWQALKPVSHLAHLTHVTMPALIVHGSDDEDCPVAHAHRMHEGIRDATLHVIPGARHSLLTQNTQAVGVAVRAFLSRHSAPSQPPFNRKENS
ncbi:alpha/beta fold hydrolase [Pandoraea sp. PE-S2T-3]|uniref:alpha/beta fold hydrolase n=1 Tax=Pandoraea sp. PE-S2T-3 TaxID=1986993 RepID=UPI000B405676|nr:alpha/beta fold hydrolase [Pandoraea sp. PE-S2T-3]